VPACRASATDEIAALSVKSPLPERGGAAELRASAKSRVLTVTRKDGTTAVTWEASDPIASVVDVWRSSYGRIAVVEYSVRRAGREVHEVVGFDLGVGGQPADTVIPTDPVVPPDKTPGVVIAPADPALAKAADKARKAKGKAALAAWAKVLELDADTPRLTFASPRCMPAARPRRPRWSRYSSWRRPSAPTLASGWSRRASIRASSSW